ncbi:YARHG domain-containing protein [Archangium violaceum]|uniref:YARHG domain-containing protein n=1 Tax=Archangium violaceum TaxID=83451 RepID=UPI00195074DB|nr:YARHG domain-containing protein [Archangium violaceum]QRN97925.1 YARHG domain-containing protein [Archangium violaceum]
MRVALLVSLLLPGLGVAAEPYVPPAAIEIAGYSEKPLCPRGVEDDPDTEEDESIEPDCPALRGKSLRELSILRNTIFARYGWAGFRKTWLREHFKQQPWFKPNPSFSYKLLSDVDRVNVQAIARHEMSLTYQDLEERRDTLLAKAGKWWGDAPTYEDAKGRDLPSCDPNDFMAADAEQKVIRYEFSEVEKEIVSSKDCTYHRSLASSQPSAPRAPDFKKLEPQERIELGLLSRAMGSFASDDASRGELEKSLDEVLSLKELRELSLRDLRLLRNTLYARRGRPFKSPVLQKHFAHMPWYKADPDYTDARLTKNDQRNVKLIQSVEKELGGALKDEDFLIPNPEHRKDPPDPGFISGA